MKTQRWAIGVLLAVTGCGGLVATTEKTKDGPGATSPNPSSGDSPSTSATGTGGPTASFTPHVPKSHRPSATDCVPTDDDDAGVDGGVATCTSDSECGGTVCECGQDFSCFDRQKNTCLSQGNCLTDSDCGKSGFCSYSTDGAYCALYRPPGYFCHTPVDFCSDDTDCSPDQYGPNSCQFIRELGRWQCAAAGP